MRIAGSTVLAVPEGKGGIICSNNILVLGVSSVGMEMPQIFHSISTGKFAPSCADFGVDYAN